MDSGFRKAVLIFYVAVVICSKASSAAPLADPASNSLGSLDANAYSDKKIQGSNDRKAILQVGLLQANGQGYVTCTVHFSHG